MKIKCMECQYEGKAKRETPGSFIIEVILWLCFLVPGIIYSMWRITSKRDICPDCGSRRLLDFKKWLKRQSA